MTPELHDDHNHPPVPPQGAAAIATHEVLMERLLLNMRQCAQNAPGGPY